MNKIALLSSFTLLASGCANVYERAATHLNASVWRDSVGFSGGWEPVGIPHPRNLTDDEKASVNAAMKKCIQELNVGVGGWVGWPSPNEAMAAGQLIECMRTKGWQYIVGEIVITT